MGVDILKPSNVHSLFISDRHGSQASGDHFGTDNVSVAVVSHAVRGEVPYLSQGHSQRKCLVPKEARAPSISAL